MGTYCFFYGSLLNSKTSASSRACPPSLVSVCVCLQVLPLFTCILCVFFSHCCCPLPRAVCLVLAGKTRSSHAAYAAMPKSAAKWIPLSGDAINVRSGWGQSRCGYIKLIFTPTLAATFLCSRCSLCHAPDARSLLPLCVVYVCVCVVCVFVLTCACSSSTCFSCYDLAGASLPARAADLVRAINLPPQGAFQHCQTDRQTD